MAATNDFQSIAGGSGANVLTQAEYLALTTILANGMTSGIVPSNQMNKMLRQCSIIAAMVAQLIADATGQNATDDGTTATLEANLARAIRGDVWQGVDTGAVNAYAVALKPASLALAPGMLVTIDAIVATNTAASTLDVDGHGALPVVFPGGGALAGGELVAGDGAIFRLNHAGTEWILISSTGADVGPTPTAGDNSTKRATTAFVQLLSGATSLTGSGYRKFPAYPGDPNPLILQWGVASLANAQNATVTLPIAFPNQALRGYASDAGSTTVYAWGANFPSLSQIKLWCSATPTSAACQWWAIGN